MLCKKQINSSEQFADSTKGIHVFAHFDRLLDWCSYKKFKGPIYIVMYKVWMDFFLYFDEKNEIF